MVKIVANNVSLDYPIYSSPSRSLKKAAARAALGGILRPNSEGVTVVRALDGLDFEFSAGERVAIVGHNGSGKTTLLKAIAGIYSPSGGVLQVTGRIVSLLDISLGIDPDATGRENIIMRGVIMGMKRAEIRAKVDEIIEFTQLEEYIDLPFRAYSSGMQVRLAFSISTALDADIVVMDEWLAVGDAAFQAQAAERLKNLVERSAILVLATHDPQLVKAVCTREIKLEHGIIVSDTPLRVDQ